MGPQIPDVLRELNKIINTSFNALPIDPHLEDLKRQIHFEGRQQEIEEFRVTWIILTVVLSFVAVIGGVGNALVIYAFRRNYSTSGGSNSSRCVGGGNASNLFIIILATIDLTICLIDIPATIYWNVWQMSTIDIVCKLHVSLKAFFIPVSSLVLVLIAVDRFFIICFVPGIQMRPRITLIALLATFLLGVAMAIPMGLHTGVTNEIPVDTDDALISEQMRPPPMLLQNLTLANGEFFQTDRSHNDKPKTNYGPCKVDQRYINNIQYNHYLRIVFGVFILMFIAITFLYAIIFIFVWWRQRRWFRRYSGDAMANNSAVRNHNPSIKVDDISQTTTSEIGLEMKNQQINSPKQRKSLCISIHIPLKILKKQPPAEVNLPLTPTKIHQQPVEQNNHNATDYNPDSDQADIELCPQSSMEKRFSGISTAQRKKHQDRYIQSSIRRRRSGSETGHMKRRKPHIRTAQTLAIITVTFILSYMPYLLIINEIVGPTRKPSSKTGPSFEEHLLRFFFFLYFFNSAANPIIYSCMNVTFRGEVIRILQRIKRTFIGQS